MRLLKFRNCFLIVLLILPLAASAQLFRPLNLGFNGGERQGNFSQPRMHVESDRLYVCTCQGLYAKDLSADNSVWQLVGFKGIPLQDYARHGNDILALRYNEGGSFLLLSHDGGQTYEDVTPEIFQREKHERLLSLAQHPTDPNTLLVSSLYCGLLLSTDFGQTWSCQNYWGDESRTAYWFFSAFDNEHPDTVYIAGCLGRNGQKDACIKLMCSTDGGHSWHPSQVMTSESEFDRINDLQQYGDCLIIYSESDVYEVSKAELVAQNTTAIRSIESHTKECPTYDLLGRKVVEPRHGFYINNGRKIFK